MDSNTELNLPGKFNITSLQGGFRVTFYCRSCEKTVTKEIYNIDSVEEAIKLAWQDTKKYFNRCNKCGEWVCDEHYNEDVMKCVLCQPK